MVTNVPLAQIRSIDDLRGLGRFSEAKALVQKQVGVHLRVVARSWVDLLTVVRHLPQAGVAQSAFFQSREAEEMFYLLEYDGDRKLEHLGVSVRHFSDPKLARVWRDELLKRLHPDRCQHLKAAAATAEVNKLYSSMIQAR